MGWASYFTGPSDPKLAVGEKCSRCREFQQACFAHFVNVKERPNVRRRPIEIKLYDNFEQLFARGQKGCQLCRCWIRALLGECTSSADRKKLRESTSAVFAATPFLRLSSPDGDDTGTRDAHYFKVWTEDLGGYGIRYEAVLRLGETSFKLFEEIMNIGQTSASAWVRSQLELCESEHSVCPELKVSQELPTRLLALRKEDFCVVDSTNIAQDAQYAALSYCWGDRQEALSRLKLFKANEAELRSGLPLSMLEKTVRDAALFCIELGIQYLWLDALCIFQDTDADVSDWEKESAKIGLVYGNARLTLSISSASAASDGFLEDDLDLPISYKQRELCGKLPIPRRKTLADIRRRSAVSERGWIFQEELLSPRILYWSDYGLFWSCTERKAAQSRVILTGDELFPQIKVPDLMDPHEFRTSQDPLLLWDDMITSYSVRKFDRESDRLPAVSGLAALIEKSTGDKYMAGLWKSRLPAQLLWAVEDPQQVLNNERIDIPSWSWAAIGAACNIHMPRQASSYAKLLDSSSSTELHVRSRAREMTVALRQVDEFPFVASSAMGLRVPSLSQTSDVWVSNSKQVLLCRDWKQPILIFLDRQMPDLEQQEAEVSRLLCLEINYMGLLLLRPVLRGGRQVYERIGCAQRHRDSSFFQDAAEVDVVLV